MAASVAAPTLLKRWRSAPGRCWLHARFVWGLALDGAEGVRAVLDHLRAELVRALELCGAARLDQISDDLVTKPGCGR